MKYILSLPSIMLSNVALTSGLIFAVVVLPHLAWGMRPAKVVDKNLPNVLIIGDSIANGYRGVVAKELAGKANVDAWLTPLHHASAELHGEVARVLSSNRYSIVHFNLGLHGWQKGKIQAGQYGQLAKDLVRTIRAGAHDATLIWASSTPVSVKGSPEDLNTFANSVILGHNALAENVMKDEKIAVNDLYTLMVGKHGLSRGDTCHWTKEGSAVLGKAVAGIIAKALKEKP